jgi:4-aminobutyrate aminotransferase/(S)-3-amino-2-methylpropionate transaminase
MNQHQSWMHRRQAVVPGGISIFADTTLVSGTGATFIDPDNKPYIDFAAGIGVNTIGHCHPKVAAAIAAQAQQCIHANFNLSTYEVYLTLAEKLVALFPHGEKTKVMLTCTGAESVENAIKIARQATKRSAIICYTEAFHGRSMMAMSLTSKVGYKYNCGPFAPEVYRIPFPNYYHYHDGLSLDDFVAREIHRLESTFINTIPANEVAAIIIEVVQGEGGFNVVPAAYLKALRTICSQKGILLIIDEVQTGFCRTGQWAAYQHFDVIPDLSTWAKAMGGGLPIGCVIGRADIMDAAIPGTIGGTYPGNPVCCAAALAAIEVMEEENLCQRAHQIAHIFQQHFQSLRTHCPAIGDIRGLGPMMAIEFVHHQDPKQPNSTIVDAILKHCWQEGLLVIPAGAHRNILRFLPPLVITDAELTKGLAILEKAVVAAMQ